ncbi:MAG: uroporphyrinogen-III synthase [Cyanobacteria bacterium SZAS LIN-2]|nr:uroporphyrinogen-III synthase [Cyanobacteria bacterium SZAS LIN-2]
MIKSDTALSGVRILVTRAREENSVQPFSELLRHRGAEVLEIPVIDIKAPDDLSQLDRGLQNIADYDWLIFASKNAVKYTLARAQALGLDIAAAPLKLQLAAVGPATAQSLKKAGLPVAFCPTTFVAEKLIDEFPGYPRLAGLKIFWPRTNIGRDLIAEKLTAAGATVDTALAYVTGLPADAAQLAGQLVDALRQGQIDVITLASAQSAKNLKELINMGLKEVPGSHIDALLAPVKIAAIGPVTGRAAIEHLGRVDVQSEQYTLSGLTESLLASLKFPQKEQ